MLYMSNDNEDVVLYRDILNMTLNITRMFGDHTSAANLKIREEKELQQHLESRGLASHFPIFVLLNHKDHVIVCCKIKELRIKVFLLFSQTFADIEQHVVNKTTCFVSIALLKHIRHKGASFTSSWNLTSCREMCLPSGTALGVFCGGSGSCGTPWASAEYFPDERCCCWTHYQMGRNYRNRDHIYRLKLQECMHTLKRALSWQWTDGMQLLPQWPTMCLSEC